MGKDQFKQPEGRIDPKFTKLFLINGINCSGLPLVRVLNTQPFFHTPGLSLQLLFLVVLSLLELLDL